MKNTLLILTLCIASIGSAFAQTNPIITSWVQNHDGTTGRHYIAGNSTPITDAVEANVQSVDYSSNWVYVSATGIPAYITGPFQDGNPSLASNQNAIYKFPLAPTQNTGTPTATTAGNNGVFINGVSLFDYRDGVAWNIVRELSVEDQETRHAQEAWGQHRHGIEMLFLLKKQVSIVQKHIQQMVIIIIIKTLVLLI